MILIMVITLKLSLYTMSPYKYIPYFLICLFLNCITFYERIPSGSSDKQKVTSTIKFQSQEPKPFSYEKDIPLLPGETIGGLKYDPNADFFKINIEEKRKYKTNNSPFLCLISILTITLVPCYYDAVETIQFSVTSPYFFEKRKPIEQEIRKREYAWLPLFLVIPFMGDKSPDDGNLLALKEAEVKLLNEYSKMESEIEETKKKLKPLIKNPKKYAIILNDFATTDFSNQSYSFNIGTGKDIIIQIFNNSFKTITKMKYHLAATNSFFKSSNEVSDVIVNEETIFPGGFSKNIFYANRNPRPNSLYLFMDKIEIEYDDGSYAVISKSAINQIKVISSPRLIDDLFK